MTQAQAYRPEIDGLRAVSVIAVLIFHLAPRSLPGGFLGVDVFFVISGYLITQVLLADIDTGKRFREVATQFYRRRVMRIMPLYVFVSLACLIAGWFLLLPSDFASTLRTAWYGAVFQSNRVFAESTEYFSPILDSQPLLHTWSLSIEEQFYLLWPVVLLAVSRQLGGRRLPVLVGLTILLVGVSELLTASAESAGYFLLRARAYEPMIGACLALYVRAHPERLLRAPVLGGVALAGLLASFFLVGREMHPPGLIALVPTLCAAALILSGGPARAVLALRPLVVIGTISYSLYLVHWPLLCFTRYLGSTIDLRLGIVLVALVLAVSFATHRLIETRLRYLAWSLPRAVAVMVIAPLALIGGARLAAWRTDDFSGWLTETARAKVAVQQQFPFQIRKDCHNVAVTAAERCLLGAPGRATAVLWGDSHANHYTGLFDEVGLALGMTIHDVTANICAPILEGRGLSSDCLARNREVFAQITSNPQLATIYLAAAWSHTDHDGLTTTIERLRGAGKRVVIMGEIPELPLEQVGCPIKAEQHPWLGLSCETADQRSSRDAPLREVARRTETPILNVPDLFCDGTVCTQEIDGVPLYRYGDLAHLSMGGSRALGRALLRRRPDVFR